MKFAFLVWLQLPPVDVSLNKYFYFSCPRLFPVSLKDIVGGLFPVSLLLVFHGLLCDVFSGGWELKLSPSQLINEIVLYV